MPPPPPWVPILHDVTGVVSLAGSAFLLLGVVGGALSPRLKAIRKPLVVTGLVLWALCLVAGWRRVWRPIRWLLPVAAANSSSRQ